jgi:hypothetical protein
MLESIFKGSEEQTEVPPVPQAQTAPVVTTPAPSAVKVVKTPEPVPQVCTNCEDSGFTCSVCGYNKP